MRLFGHFLLHCHFLLWLQHRSMKHFDICAEDQKLNQIVIYGIFEIINMEEILENLRNGLTHTLAISIFIWMKIVRKNEFH